LKKFQHHLLGRRFEAITDHNPLVCLARQRAQGTLTRWLVVMQEFDFNLKYRRGELNTKADALSRQPLAERAVNSGAMVALVKVQPSDTVGDITCEQLRYTVKKM